MRRKLWGPQPSFHSPCGYGIPSGQTQAQEGASNSGFCYSPGGFFLSRRFQLLRELRVGSISGNAQASEVFISPDVSTFLYLSYLGKKQNNKHLFRRILANKIKVFIKLNNQFCKVSSVFFQMSFSHNNVPILGKPEGKEKQDPSECNVSRVTALWFYRGCSKPGPGRSSCQVPGELLLQHASPITEAMKHRQNTQPLTRSASFILPIMQHQKSSKGSQKTLKSGPSKAAKGTKAKPTPPLLTNTEMLRESPKNTNGIDA